MLPFDFSFFRFDKDFYNFLRWPWSREPRASATEVIFLSQTETSCDDSDQKHRAALLKPDCISYALDCFSASHSELDDFLARSYSEKVSWLQILLTYRTLKSKSIGLPRKALPEVFSMACRTTSGLW